MENVNYTNVKTGRDYAVVVNNEVLIATAAQKSAGQVVFHSPSGETVIAAPTQIFPKKMSEAVSEQIKSAAKVSKKGGRVKDPSSKAQRAINIVRLALASEQPRKDTLQELVNELGLTPAGASTYYQNAKKVVRTA